jgi:hypothetical protein
MKIISFYTGHYQWDAEQLMKSMNKLGVTDYIVEYKDRIGSWERNTQMKAPFILQKLKNEESVVWTDADSRIRQLPSFFDNIDTDVGLFFLSQTDAGEFRVPEGCILKQDLIDKQGFLQSGTMFFNNTPKTIALLERWIELNEQDSTQWDQWTLQIALNQVGATVTQLPPEYVWIDGISRGVFGDLSPVIEHLQASRRYKKIIR